MDKIENEVKSSLWSRNFSLLFFSNFFLFFGAEMLAPVLPVFMAYYGGNDFQIGLVMSSFTISAIVIRLFTVKITDCFGKRFVLILSLAVCALAAFGYYITSALALILLLRVLHGFGFGASTTLYGALVSNIVPPPRIGEGMGIFGLGITIAAALGPFLGAMVVTDPKNRWICLLSAGLIVTAVVLTQLSSAGKEPGKRDYRALLKIDINDFFEKKSILPSVLIMLFGVTMAGIFTYIVLFGNQAGIKGIGLFFLLNSFAELLVRPVSGKVYDRKGHFVVLLPAVIICAAGTLMLAFTRNIAMLIAASLLFGIGTGTLYPVLEAWALGAAVPERRVAASATFYNFLDVGIGLGTFILGIIAQLSDYRTMYASSSAVFLIFFAIYIPYAVKDRKRYL